MRLPLERIPDLPGSYAILPGGERPEGKNDVVEMNLQIPKRKGGPGPWGAPSESGMERMESQEGGAEDPDDTDFPGQGGPPPGGPEGSGRGERPQRPLERPVNGLDLKVKITLSAAPEVGPGF